MRRYEASWILMFLLLVWGGNPGPAVGAPSTQPNVILITVDTLRADHLGCYGDATAATPHMDHLATDGIRFADASAHVPLTLPSHASIMTGTYPPTHGVRDNIGYTLAEDQVTLAELLKAQGYATGGFVGAFVLDSKTGIDQGFDHFSDDFDIDLKETRMVNLAYVEKRGDEVVENALAWLQQHKTSPFFAWIHLFDPHDPYRPPPPFEELFPEDRYRGEVAYTDMLIGEIIGWLKQEQLYDNALVVFTSDHGEALGEHGEPTHGLFVYESVLRVPLIIKLPGQVNAGTTMAPPVQSIDILPTVLQSLGIDQPAAVQGVELLSRINSKSAPARLIYAESLYPRTQYGWSALRCIREGSFKYIQAPRAELYDLSTDPLELENLLQQNKTMASRLKASLQSFRETLEADQTSSQATQVDAETLARLRALGYVGNAAGLQVQGLADQDLADPKDKLEVYRVVLRELRGANRAKGPERIGRLESILEKDPNLTVVLSSLGEAYVRLNQYDKALSALKKGLAIRPWDEALRYLVAYCYLQNNEVDVAIFGFDQILAENPNHTGAMTNRGVALTRQNRLDAAVEQFRLLLNERPGDPQGHEGLGYAYLKKGLVDEAAQQFEAALTSDPEMAKAHLWTGYCHLERAKAYQDKTPRHVEIPRLVSQARQAFARALELDSDLRSKIPPSLQP